jgi:hypothetical protein
MKTTKNPKLYEHGIHFRISDDTKAEFEKFCKRQGVSMSRLLQNLIFYGLRDKKKFKKVCAKYLISKDLL